MDESSTPKRVSRRTIAKGAAWTVPAVAVVSPTPAMAASPGTVTLIGNNCKLPGNSADPWDDGAVFLLAITNTTNDSIDIDITSVTRGSDTQDGSLVTVVKLSGPGTCCTSLTNEFSVAAISSGTYALVTRDWGASANNDVSVSYTVNTLPQPDAEAPPTGNLNPMGFNPQCTSNTGSCTAITEAQQRCIFAALGECPTGVCS